jgi:hypothetical protein
METLTPSGLSAVYRDRQHLADRVAVGSDPRTAVLDEVGHQIGLQSQAPLPPYTALWTRIAGFRPEWASELVRSGDLVRVVCMRSTIHLVRAEDAWMLRALSAPVLLREYGAAIAPRLPGVDVDAVIDAASGLLDGVDLPSRELGVRLAARFTDHAGPDLVNLVRCHLPLVQRPPRGEWGTTGPVTYGRLDRHVPVRDIDPVADAGDLLLRYLRAYGPATAADAAQWSGLRGIREVASSVAHAIVSVEVDGRPLLDAADASRTPTGAAPPARLLAEFDAAVLSHKDKRRIIPEVAAGVISSPNGLIPSTFLIDGVVAGRWTIAVVEGRAHATVRPVGALPVRAQAALRRELRAVARDLHGATLDDVSVERSSAHAGRSTTGTGE